MTPNQYTFRYRVRNWSDYNRALIARGRLTFWFEGHRCRLAERRHGHSVCADIEVGVSSWPSPRAALALWSWLDAVGFENVANRGVRDVEAQVG